MRKKSSSVVEMVEGVFDSIPLWVFVFVLMVEIGIISVLLSSR